MLNRSAALLLSCILCFLVVGSLCRSFEWDSDRINVNILDNGDLEISETQTIQFHGRFESGYRTIPVGFPGRNDGITLLAILEGDIEYKAAHSEGGLHTYTVKHMNNELVVNWFMQPTAATGSTSRSFVFKYLVKGALREQQKQQQQQQQQWVLFWKAIPFDHPANINKQAVTVQLPSGSKISNAFFYVNGQPCVADDVHTKIEKVQRDMSPLVRMERDIVLPKNIMLEMEVVFSTDRLSAVQLQRPKWQDVEDFSQLLSNLAYALLVVALLLPVVLIVVLRAPKVTAFVPQLISEPPHSSAGEYLTPACAAALVNNSIGMKAVLATVVDLARRGYLTITDSRTDFIFTRQTDTTRVLLGDVLTAYEAKLLSLLFPPNERSLKSLTYHISPHLQSIYNSVYKDLVKFRLWKCSFVTIQLSCNIISTVLAVAAFFAFVNMDVYGVVYLTATYPLMLSKSFCYLLILVAGSLGFLVNFSQSIIAVTTPVGALEKLRWKAYAAWLANINAGPIQQQQQDNSTLEMQELHRDEDVPAPSAPDEAALLADTPSVSVASTSSALPPTAVAAERPLSQQLLESNLAYAIAFGVETALTKKIEHLEQQQRQQQQQQPRPRPPLNYPTGNNGDGRRNDNNNNNNNNNGTDDNDNFGSSGYGYRQPTYHTIYFPYWYIPRHQSFATTTPADAGAGIGTYTTFSERMDSMLRTVSTTFSSIPPTKSSGGGGGGSFSGGGGSMGFR